MRTLSTSHLMLYVCVCDHIVHGLYITEQEARQIHVYTCTCYIHVCVGVFAHVLVHVMKKLLSR